ncbi:MAG: hypothetical protein KDD43_03400 [Bdellovibrionales bacterium]|nr:hypothetical protein [Bdellovibrionales bacterium]
MTNALLLPSLLAVLALSHSALARESVECEITRDRCLVRVCREIKVDCGDNLIGYLSNYPEDKFIPQTLVVSYRDRRKNIYAESSPLPVPEEEDVRAVIATLTGYNRFMFKQPEVKDRFDPSEIGIVKRATIEKEKLLPLLYKDQRGDSQMFPPKGKSIKAPDKQGSAGQQ